MKKLALTLAILLGIATTSFAQNDAFGGGLLQRGETPQYNYFADWADLGWTRTTSGLFNLPDQHGLPGDSNAPLGSGLLLLAGMGAAYALKKRKDC